MAFILAEYAYSKLHSFGAELGKKCHSYGWASLSCAVAFYYGFDLESCKQEFFVLQDQQCIHFWKKIFNANIVFVCTSISLDRFIELLLLSCKKGRISTRVDGC